MKRFWLPSPPPNRFCEIEAENLISSIAFPRNAAKMRNIDDTLTFLSDEARHRRTRIFGCSTEVMKSLGSGFHVAGALAEVKNKKNFVDVVKSSRGRKKK